MRRSFALSHAVLVFGTLVPSSLVAFQHQDALIHGQNLCYDWIAGAPVLSNLGGALVGIAVGSFVLLIANFARRK